MLLILDIDICIDICSSWDSKAHLDDTNIELLLSKPIDFNNISAGLINNPNQAFTVHIDSTNSVIIAGMQFDPNFPRIINLQLNSAIQGWSSVTGAATKVAISYLGNQISAIDGTPLASFSYKPVTYTICVIELLNLVNGEKIQLIFNIQYLEVNIILIY